MASSTIELWQFPPAFGLMNPSPFCMKVEVFLRLAGLPYRCSNGKLPTAGPKGKLPVLRDGGQLVPDSQAIITHLQQRYGNQMHPALAAPETAVQHALRRMLEEHTYFGEMWARWVNDAGWAVVGPTFFAKLPPVLRSIVPPLIRRKMRRDVWGQGMGRHAKDEIAARLMADLDATAEILGAQPYFAGNDPGAIDACTYAFLANLLWAPFESPVRAHALGKRNLVDYAERMKARVGAS